MISYISYNRNLLQSNYQWKKHVSLKIAKRSWTPVKGKHKQPQHEPKKEKKNRTGKDRSLSYFITILLWCVSAH